VSSPVNGVLDLDETSNGRAVDDRVVALLGGVVYLGDVGRHLDLSRSGCPRHGQCILAMPRCFPVAGRFASVNIPECRRIGTI
jgi:hypothetical protein